jgi:hypothetical protein
MTVAFALLIGAVVLLAVFLCGASFEVAGEIKGVQPADALVADTGAPSKTVRTARAQLNISIGLTYFGAAGEQISVPLSSIAADPDGGAITISDISYSDEDKSYYEATINGNNLLIRFIKAMPEDFNKTDNLTVTVADFEGNRYDVLISVDSQGKIADSLPVKTILFIEGAVALFLFFMILIAISGRRKNDMPDISQQGTLMYSITDDKRIQTSQGMPQMKRGEPIDIYLKNVIDKVSSIIAANPRYNEVDKAPQGDAGYAGVKKQFVPPPNSGVRKPHIERFPKFLTKDSDIGDKKEANYEKEAAYEEEAVSRAEEYDFPNDML